MLVSSAKCAHSSAYIDFCSVLSVITFCGMGTIPISTLIKFRKGHRKKLFLLAPYWAPLASVLSQLAQTHIVKDQAFS